MHIEIIPMLAAAAAPATVSEWINQYGKMLLEGIWGTVYMTLVSTFIGYLFGLPMGVLLTVTRKDGLKPNALIYKIMDVIANIVRSVPFLILLILLIPPLRGLLWERVTERRLSSFRCPSRRSRLSPVWWSPL